MTARYGRLAALLVAVITMSILAPLFGSAAAAITVGSVTSNATSTTGSSLALTVPTGTSQFDVLVAQIVVKTDTTAITAPAGWTLIRSDASVGGTAARRVTLASYWHVAGAAEAGTSATWTYTGTYHASGGVLDLKGVDNAFPVDITASATDTNSPSTAPAVSTTTANTLVVHLVGLEAADSCSTIPAGALAYSVPNGGTGAANAKTTACAASRSVVSAGTTGTYDFTLGGNVDSVLQTIAFRLPTIGFVSSSASGSESTTPASVAVSLSGASSKSTSAAFTVSGSSTATVGASCSGATDVVVSTASPIALSAGATSASISLTVCNDAVGESSETVVLTLSSPSEANLATATFTFTITDDDARLAVAADPVLADGSAATGVSWGGWAADPGAGNVGASNYLKITNTGDAASQAFTINFSPATFAGVSDGTQTIAIDGNVQFACREATAGQAPQDVVPFTFGATSGTGSLSSAFTALGNVFYCTYRLVALPDPLADQAYSAAFTVI